MNEFTSGPFAFEPFGITKINDSDLRRWELRYGAKLLADRRAPAGATQDQVREIFSDDIAEFVREHRPQPAPAKRAESSGFDLCLIEEATGRVLGGFRSAAPIAGLSAGLTDDRWPTWLVTASQPTFSLPMTPDEFERLQAAHNAAHAAEFVPCPRPHITVPAYAWVADLLLDDVLDADPGNWRSPTSWELRHVVGEGSFTGVSGAKAAALVGVTPQNFRKYTASDSASTRQSMSFAMWHLLLAKLQVKLVSC